MTAIRLPALSLVLLLGASGSGKSSFARKHFLGTEVLSSDWARGLVADDENDQQATKDAFDLLFTLADKRLARGKLTVVDATNVKPEDRKGWLALAKRHDVLAVAIVLDMPEALCHTRNAARPDRDFGPHVVRNHCRLLRASFRNLDREGFRQVWTLRSPEEADAAEVARVPLWPDRRDEHGPFDIIGDVHGCADELEALLAALGYVQAPREVEGEVRPVWAHPEGRKALFLGDLVDRGPRIVDTLWIARDMVTAGVAMMVPGNHDVKLLKKLRGRDVRLTHGLAQTVAEIEALAPDDRAAFDRAIPRFLDGLVGHYVLDGGKLVVAHAGMKEAYQGRASGRVREFGLYGETTGELDDYGLPVRHDWASEYRGRAAVVYGHTASREAAWVNNTICVDTGCVFGGKLTALRWPERTLVAVPAARVYYEAHKPLEPPHPPTPYGEPQIRRRPADMLDLADVTGKRLIETRLAPKVMIQEANAIAALEVMSRFAVDPRWLVYLPPTMSPSETSKLDGVLEHPAEAFAYYAAHGVEHVVIEEKHMGSRAVVVVARDEAAARRRFGVPGEAGSEAPHAAPQGVVYTRTGRRFFEDPALEAAFLARVAAAVGAAGLWEALATDWLVLDAELMPWSAKAQELLRGQYAAVGAAARAALPLAVDALERALAAGVDVGALHGHVRTRAALAVAFVAAYGRHCWPVEGLDDLKLAPFHVLAAEGATFFDRPHAWHMETIAALAACDPGLLVATPYRTITLSDPAQVAEGVAWWEALTGRGGEGMVVKPAAFVARGEKGLLQPAVKCRGPEYLRIIYGPEYTLPTNLERLRRRGLGAKRALALREFALGVEALERFVAGEPLYRVHECVFGVLALESEPVDPRL